MVSHYLQRYFADFLELLLKRRHLKNLQKSVNKLTEIQNNDENEIIDSNIDLLTNFF